jgi:Domain of unknown function (DUF4372)
MPGRGGSLVGISIWRWAFAQLTYRGSLRDIEACLRSLGGKLYHMGLRGRVAHEAARPHLTGNDHTLR